MRPTAIDTQLPTVRLTTTDLEARDVLLCWLAAQDRPVVSMYQNRKGVYVIIALEKPVKP